MSPLLEHILLKQNSVTYLSNLNNFFFENFIYDFYLFLYTMIYIHYIFNFSWFLTFLFASPSPACNSSIWCVALNTSKTLLAAINSSLSDDWYNPYLWKLKEDNALDCSERRIMASQNWKHCSKIIFKYVNSIVGSNFEKKNYWIRQLVGLVNSTCGSREQYMWPTVLDANALKLNFSSIQTEA